MRRSFILRRRGLAYALPLAAVVFFSNGVKADEALAKKNSCTACHAMTTKVMGPSFRDIAAKYANNPDAVEALSRSIREGGTGRWGTLSMPPQAQLPPATVKALASWLAAGAK